MNPFAQLMDRAATAQVAAAVLAQRHRKIRQRPDLCGRRFDRWTVLHRAGAGLWRCRCDCGTERTVAGFALKAGGSRSCGCGRTADMVPGRRFGRWVLVGLAAADLRGTARWHCRCDCGTERIVRAHNLRQGDSRSCGCIRRRNVEETTTVPAKLWTPAELELVARATNTEHAVRLLRLAGYNRTRGAAHAARYRLLKAKESTA